MDRGLTILATLVLFAACTVPVEKTSNKPRNPIVANDPQEGTPQPGEDGEIQLTPMDGGSIDTVDGGPAVMTWCNAQSATFCADFDRDLTGGWSAKGGSRGEARPITGGTSAPNAFAAVTDPVGDGVVARAYLRKDFADIPKDEFLVSFAVRLEQVGATLEKGATLGVVQAGVYPQEHELQLNVFSGGKACVMERGPLPPEDGGTRTYKRHDLPAFALGDWQKVAIRVSLTKNTFNVAINDVEELKDEPLVAPIPAVKPPSLFLGITYVDPPSARWDVRYDDLIVSMR
jgi:hypothetical protein